MSSAQNNRFNFNSNEICIINMLNNMYTNNNRMIDNLLQMNEEILNMIQNVLQQNSQNNVNTTTTTRGASSSQRRQMSNNVLRNINTTRTNNTPVLETIPNIQSTSYIIDYIQPDYVTRLLETFMDPVLVRSTQTEIDNATSVVRYGDILNPLNNSCPISLEPFHDNDMVTIIEFCGHVFKTNEIQHWFQTNVRCPVCRYDIRNSLISSRETHRNSSTPATRGGNRRSRNPIQERTTQRIPETPQTPQTQTERFVQIDENNIIQNLFTNIMNDLSNNVL